MTTTKSQIERYPIGHDTYPEGCVVTTEVDEDGNVNRQEYSLAEWDEQQQS